MQSGKIIGFLPIGRQGVHKYKRVVALLLMLLFMIHSLGFFLVFYSMKSQHASDWQRKSQKNIFDSEQYAIASIPISFPYQANQKEFMNVNESIELNGNFYQIVKKRYENDTLYIVYVDDQTTQKINTQFSRWVDETGKRELTPTTSETRVNMPIFDYQYLVPPFTFQVLGAAQFKSNIQFSDDAHFNQVVLSIPSPPPELTILVS